MLAGMHGCSAVQPMTRSVCQHGWHRDFLANKKIQSGDLLGVGIENAMGATQKSVDFARRHGLCTGFGDQTPGGGWSAWPGAGLACAGARDKALSGLVGQHGVRRRIDRFSQSFQ